MLHDGGTYTVINFVCLICVPRATTSYPHSSSSDSHPLPKLLSVGVVVVLCGLLNGVGEWPKRRCGRPEAGGVGTAKTVKRPPQQPAQPQYANYWLPLTRKRHILPHPAQPQHTNHWAPRRRKRHQQEHRPQRPTESSNLTQHAKGRTGDCPGPRKETTTRRNVTQGG